MPPADGAGLQRLERADHQGGPVLRGVRLRGPHPSFEARPALRWQWGAEGTPVLGPHAARPAAPRLPQKPRLTAPRAPPSAPGPQLQGAAPGVCRRRRRGRGGVGAGAAAAAAAPAGQEAAVGPAHVQGQGLAARGGVQGEAGPPLPGRAQRTFKSSAGDPLDGGHGGSAWARGVLRAGRHGLTSHASALSAASPAQAL